MPDTTLTDVTHSPVLALLDQAYEACCDGPAVWMCRRVHDMWPTYAGLTEKRLEDS
jgi:hypothetical protein